MVLKQAYAFSTYEFEPFCRNQTHTEGGYLQNHVKDQIIFKWSRPNGRYDSTDVQL